MDTFALDISKFIEKTKVRAEDALGKITLNIFTDVVFATPVDTGRARANWMPSWNTADVTVNGNTDPTGSAKAAEITGFVASFSGGGRWDAYLSNSLDYVQTLEYGLYPDPPKRPTGKTVGGYSTQAPQGMVRITVQAFSENMVRALI